MCSVRNVVMIFKVGGEFLSICIIAMNHVIDMWNVYKFYVASAPSLTRTFHISSLFTIVYMPPPLKSSWFDHLRFEYHKTFVTPVFLLRQYMCRPSFMSDYYYRADNCSLYPTCTFSLILNKNSYLCSYIKCE